MSNTINQPKHVGILPKFVQTYKHQFIYLGLRFPTENLDT
jgi:hypothetical protein